MRAVELLAHSPRGARRLPRSPVCRGCHTRPRESPHLPWALAPRVAWLTLTSGRPCCWGASSSHVGKMRSEYLLGASAGLRRRYISIRKVQTLVMPLQWWSALHTAVRVTAFIRFWVRGGRRKGETPY